MCHQNMIIDEVYLEAARLITDSLILKHIDHTAAGIKQFSLKTESFTVKYKTPPLIPIYTGHCFQINSGRERL